MSLAVVLINCETGLESEILEKIRGIEKVKEAYIVYGAYDMVARVEAENLEELRDIILRRIRRIEGVRSTLTLVVVS